MFCACHTAARVLDHARSHILTSSFSNGLRSSMLGPSLSEPLRRRIQCAGARECTDGPADFDTSQIAGRTQWDHPELRTLAKAISAPSGISVAVVVKPMPRAFQSKTLVKEPKKFRLRLDSGNLFHGVAVVAYAILGRNPWSSCLYTHGCPGILGPAQRLPLWWSSLWYPSWWCPSWWWSSPWWCSSWWSWWSWSRCPWQC